MCDDVRVAIAREKQIKGGSRQKKVDLVNSMNSEWRDFMTTCEVTASLRYRPETHRHCGPGSDEPISTLQRRDCFVGNPAQ